MGDPSLQQMPSGSQRSGGGRRLEVSSPRPFRAPWYPVTDFAAATHCLLGQGYRNTRARAGVERQTPRWELCPQIERRPSRGSRRP